MFDAQAFFEEIGIPISGHDDTQKVQPHWIGVKCPFCNTQGPYLGFSLRKGYFSCWHCGGHSVYSTVEAFLGPNKARVLETIKAFQKSPETVNLGASRGPSKRPTTLEMPFGVGDLLPAHIRYLERRKYDPDIIQKLYKVQGTGPLGPHARRLFLPIMLNGRYVSWTTRDITKKGHGPKYMSCALEKEIIPHKKILYGIDNAKSDKCVIVEGPTDVWRMGPGALATFGIKYTKSQVKLIANNFRRVFVLFDNEDFAIRQAKRLASTLSVLGLETEVVALDEGDPGDLPQHEADYLMVQLLR